MRKVSDETRRKMSLAKIGKRRPDITGKENPNFGKDFTGRNNPNWRGGFSNAQRAKRTRKKHPETWKFYGLLARSRESGIFCDIDLTSFRNWFFSRDHICEYCGREVVMSSGDRMKSLSIDRKENSQGYTLNNLCISCNRCNTVKGNFFTYEQMKEIAEKYFKNEVITSV